MSIDEDSVTNKGSLNLTYMPWYEHVQAAVTSHLKTFVLYSLGGFGILWGLVEAGNFFYPNAIINNSFIFYCLIIVSFVVALTRCIHDYSNTIHIGLENESKNIQKIALKKNHYWEYALVFELLKQRIEKIDKDLDDVINNRVYIKIIKSLDVESYIKWLDTRPANLLGMVESAKQLLIFDLVNVMQSKDEDNNDFSSLIKIVNHIGDLYRSAFDYEVEGKEIRVPEHFEIVHEIQSEWVSVLRDSFKQFLDIYQTISVRRKGNYDPIKAEITFEEPPRISEFDFELDRLEKIYLE